MNLQRKYNRDDFVEFLKQFLPSFEKDIRPAAASSLQVTKEAFSLGQSADLDLHIFELTHSSSADARVALAMDGFRMMRDSATYRALVVYHSEKGDDWRLSLMTATPGVNEKGKVGQTLSNPRRFSFFLGPNAKVNTPYQLLIKQDSVKDFPDLQKRFSLEVVNKEFYTQIAILFTQLAGGKREIGRKSIDAGDGDLKLPSTNDDTLRKEFTVRLIGRLVFCWFLKKKKSDKGLALLSEDLLSTRAVEKYKGYYHSALEPVFFEVLNTPVEKRSKKYKQNPWDQIPFLNGGLFNPHHHDFYDPGAMGISKHINTLKIPDAWFKDLFAIFETYNFTIDENTSVDVELSIEPEMLGRIFENLLAEINPETGETARKATGSYYTPRPIVEYMVDESLKQYLLTKTGLPEDKVSALFTYEDQDTELSAREKEKIIDALDSIKIIDPACGSGAFPMGILQKMLLVLQKVDPDSQYWLDKKLASINDATLRKDLKTKLKADNFNYIHKLGIIRDAIYGVDIQPIAVEISKLRFFLSLIVDERVNDTKDNRGIEPLPNLEFKFVCANSLIGLPKVLAKDKHKDGMAKEAKQQTMFDAVGEIDELKKLRDEYLRSYGEEKKKIENKFQETQGRMFKHSLNWGARESQTLKLSQWNPFGEEPCSWFDPDWMFGIKDRFDIVIANPPYMTFSRVTGTANKNSAEDNDFKKTLLQLYPNSAEYKISTYALFINLSVNLLGKYGILSFITPETFTVGRYFSKLRRFILDTCRIKQLVLFTKDFWESGTIGLPTILFLVRETSDQIRDGNTLESIMYESLLAFENKAFSKYAYAQRYFNSTPHNRFRLFFSEKAFLLINRIEKNCIPAEDIIEMHVGVRPKIGYEKIQSDKKMGASWEKGIVKGNEVSRFCVRWAGKYLNITPKLLWGGGFDEQLVRQNKILMRKTGNELVAAIDSEGLYHLDILHGIILRNNNFDLRYMVALFNSKCINYYYKTITLSFNRVLAQINIETIEKLPIKAISLKDQKPFCDAIDQLHKLSLDEGKRKIIMAKTDQMIYDLYGLTKDEITIVEQFGAK